MPVQMVPTTFREGNFPHPALRIILILERAWTLGVEQVQLTFVASS